MPPFLVSLLGFFFFFFFFFSVFCFAFLGSLFFFQRPPGFCSSQDFLERCKAAVGRLEAKRESLKNAKDKAIKKKELGVGQNPVPPMTLKSLFKGGNLPKRYPLGFDPQPVKKTKEEL